MRHLNRKYINIKSRLVFFGFLIIISILGQSQTTVSGVVKDKSTGENLPFVNIAFTGTNNGASTNFEGYYKIESQTPVDSITITYVGYRTEKIKIKRGVSQTLDIELENEAVSLESIQIMGDAKLIDPAKALFKRIVKNKSNNNKDKYDSYQYEVYNKVDFSINNIQESFFDKKITKSFSFMKNYLDSSQGKAALPMFITESVSDFYYKKSPEAKKEFIKATKISGTKNQSASQFLGDMYQNINIYDNYIKLLNLFFVSPISDAGLLSYKYTIKDTVYVDGRVKYLVEFTPKRKQENTFNGEFWVDDSTHSIIQIKATVSEGANINWVNTLSFSQKFKEISPGNYMLEKDELLVDFEAAKSSMGMYGHKKASYTNIKVNEKQDDSFYEGANDVIILEDGDKKTNWDNLRHDTLSLKEKQIYEMVDSIQNVPAFKTIADLVQLFVLGYKVVGPLEVGPYYTLYSFNAIEGNRFRIGLRTSNSFSTRVMLEGHVAYGTKDKKFKYGLGGIAFISKNPRQIIGLIYTKDVEQLGQGLNSWRSDNILSSVLRRNPANRLNGFEQIKLTYEYEWFYGLSNKIEITQRSINPLGELSFIKQSGTSGEPTEINKLNTFEVSINTRFAKGEKYLSGEFNRISLGTKWPIINFNYAYGFNGVLNGEYEYHRLKFQLTDKIDLPPLGYSNIVFTGGKYFGILPYPLLELHNGNETYSFDNTAFNLMNFYEFVSDEYLTASITHHFNGLILNKIPLIRKLKWRELIQANAVYGTISEKNKNEYLFPATLNTLNSKPYIEAGVGIENIFKVFRVDLIKRLTYIDDAYVNNYESNINTTKIPSWGIRGTIQILF